MDNLASAPQTGATTVAGASAGTTTTLTTANTTQYAIKSKGYSKAAASNAATPTVDIVDGLAFTPIPINYGCVFVLCYDAGGNLRVAQGGIEALDVNGNFVLAPQFPVIPDTVCPFAYLVTRVASNGAAWTFGSSNLAGPPTGVTHTFVNVMLSMPDRPQVS